MNAHDAGTLPCLRKAEIVNAFTEWSFTPCPADELDEYLADIPGYDRAHWVLNHLQRSRTEPLDPSVLELLLNALLDAVPDCVRKEVGLDMGNHNRDRHSRRRGVGSSSSSDGGKEKEKEEEGQVRGGEKEKDNGSTIGQWEWFAEDDETFDAIVAEFEFENATKTTTTTKRPPLTSNNKPYILWVVNTSRIKAMPHFVTIVLHYTASDPERLPRVYDRISHWAVVDPRPARSYAAGCNPADRVHRLLKAHNNFGIENATQETIWVPPQKNREIFASGFLAYSVVAQLLDRIALMESSRCSSSNGEKEQEQKEEKFVPAMFFAPTRPYFNPDAVRAEAFGHAAFFAMKRMNYKMRLALFPIKDRVLTHNGLTGAREFVKADALRPSAAPDGVYKLQQQQFPMVQTQNQSRNQTQIQSQKGVEVGDRGAGTKTKMKTSATETATPGSGEERERERETGVPVPVTADTDTNGNATTTTSTTKTTRDGGEAGTETETYEEILDWLDEVLVKCNVAGGGSDEDKNHNNGQQKQKQKRKRKRKHYRVTTYTNDAGERFDTLHVQKRRKR